MKVFLDTNVWLSATIFSGLCEELVIQCAERGCLLSSALVQAEAHEVLACKFPQKPTAGAWFDASWQVALLLPDVADPADDNDRRLVAAAEMGGVTLFVTGDKRVLGSKARAAMRIVSPREAWVMLQDGAERSVL